MRRPFIRWRLLGLALSCAALCAAVRADGPLHALWELHGKHNTVYILGSIHVLRPSDYPLSPAVLNAYRNAKSIFMEVNLAEIDSQRMQTELLASARLPEGQTLLSIMGDHRYKRAQTLAQEVGIDLGIFDAFAPWFAAEAISQLQLQQLGFQPKSGVEMFFLERARSDGKSVAGLETVHDQIALFDALSMEQEIGRDPALYQSVLVARNRKWVPKIEALLNDDRNYLVIVGTGHLVGEGSVIDLLKKDGIVAAQR